MSTNELLVVIDVQNDFVSGSLGTAEAQAMLPRLMDKVTHFAGQIVLTQDTHGCDYLQSNEGQHLPVEHCISGTPGWELVDPLKEFAQAHNLQIFCKPSFGSMDLAAYIKEQAASACIDSVELCGLCTDICVISNALLIKAQCPELPLKVDAACCAGVSPQLHQAALQVMHSCQVEVVNV